jgi:hypothetical protein
MKRALLLLFAIAASAITTISSAQGTYSETRNVTGFEEVGFALAGEVYISLGQEYKVVIEGDKDYLAKIETKVHGTSLEIKTEKWFNTGNQKVIVRITMPLLKGLAVSGSGKVVVNDPLKTPSFEVAISGSGKIYVKDVEINSFECAISGSGNIEFEGSGTISDAELAVSGSGNLVAPTTKIARFEVHISGSGKCDCYVTESLEGAISGSGNIYYSGTPKIDASVSGSGHIRSK